MVSGTQAMIRQDKDVRAKLFLPILTVHANLHATSIIDAASAKE